jgi:hypothetical protein
MHPDPRAKTHHWHVFETLFILVDVPFIGMSRVITMDLGRDLCCEPLESHPDIFIRNDHDPFEQTSP